MREEKAVRDKSKMINKVPNRKTEKVIWKVQIDDGYSVHQYELEGPDDISVATVMALVRMNLRLLQP